MAAIASIVRFAHPSNNPTRIEQEIQKSKHQKETNACINTILTSDTHNNLTSDQKKWNLNYRKPSPPLRLNQQNTITIKAQLNQYILNFIANNQQQFCHITGESHYCQQNLDPRKNIILENHQALKQKNNYCNLVSSSAEKLNCPSNHPHQPLVVDKIKSHKEFEAFHKSKQMKAFAHLCCKGLPRNTNSMDKLEQPQPATPDTEQQPPRVEQNHQEW